MKELIKVTEKDGKQVVSARELHGFLEVETKFADWIKRMIEYGFFENEDYVTVLKKENRKTFKEYAITLEMAKEISMIQRSDKGKQARLYFIECEKKLTQQHQLPQTFAQALQLAADQAKQIELLKEKEKVADRLLTSDIAVSIGEFAKCYCDELHNIGQNRLFDLLRRRKHLIDSKGHPKHNTPYQKYIDNGYYQVIQRPYKKGDKDSYRLQTLITPKGQKWMLGNLDIILN